MMMVVAILMKPILGRGRASITTCCCAARVDDDVFITICFQRAAFGAAHISPLSRPEVSFIIMVYYYADDPPLMLRARRIIYRAEISFSFLPQRIFIFFRFRFSYMT